MINKLFIYLKLLFLFIIAGVLIYFSTMVSFNTPMINIILFIPGFFTLNVAHNKLNKILDNDKI